MSGIGPISDYDYWKLASPYDEESDDPEDQEHPTGCSCPECLEDRSDEV